MHVHNYVHVASSACTTKPLSQLLISSLKLISTHFKQYCKGSQETQASIVFGSLIMPRTEVQIEVTKGVRHFDSFDFSTLHTNIPHDLLLDSISQLIREAYRIRGTKYLVMQQSNSTAYWSNTVSTREHSIPRTN
jgi:hypothetical protein